MVRRHAGTALAGANRRGRNVSPSSLAVSLVAAGGLAALPALPPTRVRVATVAFEELTLTTDVVCVGRVLRVLELERTEEDIEHNRARIRAQGAEEGVFDRWRLDGEVRLAEVEVSRVLHGDASLRRIHYLAEGTWTCDVSDANPGETALFFLDRSRGLAEESPALLARATSQGVAQPFYQLAHSGHGRMPLRDVGGRAYATVWTKAVALPEGVETIDGPEPEYTSFISSARLEDLERIVASTWERHGISVPLHPETGEPPLASIVVVECDEPSGAREVRARLVAAFWWDGTAIWSEDGVRGGPPYFEGKFEGSVVGLLRKNYRNYSMDDVLAVKALSGDAFAHDQRGPDPCHTTMALRLHWPYATLRKAGLDAPRTSQDAGARADPSSFEGVWSLLRERILNRLPESGAQRAPFQVELR